MRGENMTNLLIGIILAAIIICILFFVILSIRQPQVSRLRGDDFSFELLTFSPGIKNIIDKALPDKTDKEYRKNERLIGDSGLNISMRVLYLFKLAIPLVLLIICLSIYLMNRNIYLDAIIEDRFVQTVDVMGTTPSVKNELTSKEKQEKEKAAKDTYEVVTKLIDTKMLKNKDSVEARLAIQNVMAEQKIATRENAAYLATEIYNKMMRVENAKKINPITLITILFISMAGFMIPNAVLEILKFIRYRAFDNEVIALEMLTILVGSVENITVKEILKILADNSKIFKKNFEKALLEYPADFEQALVNLGESSKNKDFQALISTLRQSATSDKYSALQTLQRRRISRKEYRKLTEEKRIEFKMYIGLILLVPVLFFLAKLLLSPWQDLMNTSGLF
jgi:hypothetical protein